MRPDISLGKGVEGREHDDRVEGLDRVGKMRMALGEEPTMMKQGGGSDDAQRTTGDAPRPKWTRGKI